MKIFNKKKILNLLKSIFKHHRKIKKTLAVVLFFAICYQASLLVWGVVLMGVNAEVGDAYVKQSGKKVDSWSWINQDLNMPAKKQKRRTYTRTYEFNNLSIKIVGIISRSTRSMVILKTAKKNSLLVSEGEELEGNKDIIVKKIFKNKVEFLEVDKVFTLFWGVQKETGINLSRTKSSDKKYKEREEKINYEKNGARAKNKTYRSIRAEDLNLIEEALKSPSKALEYLDFIPIFEKNKLSGVKIIILKEKERFNRMGLRSGDIVTHVDNVFIENVDTKDIDLFGGGKTTKLTLIRDGRVLNIVFGG
jgi:type II secretion system protein C